MRFPKGVPELTLLLTVCYGPRFFDLRMLQNSQLRTHTPTEAEPTAGERLQASATRFVTALIERDSQALISQFSKQGVVMESDSEPIPLDKLKVELQKSHQIYCMYFDTQCLREFPNFRREFSLRETLVRAKSFRLQVGLNPDLQKADKLNRNFGDARLFVEGNPDRGQRGEEFCDLEYVLEDNHWRILLVRFL